MNKLNRLQTVLKGVTEPGNFVLPIINGLAAKLAGVPLHRYLTDGETLAHCQLEAAKAYNYDAVFVYFDNAVEAEALGAELDWPEDGYPRVMRPILANPKDLDLLKSDDFSRIGRREKLLKACEYLHRQAAGKKLVVATVLGPASVAGQLYGLEKLLFLAVDEPLQFRKLLDDTWLMVDGYAKALIRAGADVLCLYEPAASPAVVSKEIFRTYLQPVYKQMISEWTALGLPVWSHIIGPIRNFLPLLAELGADMITIDDSIPWTEARLTLPEPYLVGNLTASLFAIQSVGEIEKTVRKLKEHADSRTIIGTDCELPLDSDPDNLRAMVRVWREG